LSCSYLVGFIVVFLPPRPPPPGSLLLLLLLLLLLHLLLILLLVFWDLSSEMQALVTPAKGIFVCVKRLDQPLNELLVVFFNLRV
jgi:hypothetical protein